MSCVSGVGLLRNISGGRKSDAAVSGLSFNFGFRFGDIGGGKKHVFVVSEGSSRVAGIGSEGEVAEASLELSEGRLVSGGLRGFTMLISLCELLFREDKFVALDDKAGVFLFVPGSNFVFLELFLYECEDLFLATVVVDDEADFGLVAHPAPGVHEDLYLFVFSKADVVDGEVDLDLHVDEVGDEHGQFVADLFEEEFGAHLHDLPAAGPVVPGDIILERVGDVLVEVVEGVVLLVYFQQFYDVVTLDQFRLFYHLALFLGQLPAAVEVLDVLDADCLSLLGGLVEGVFPAFHLHYRFDHSPTI